MTHVAENLGKTFTKVVGHALGVIAPMTTASLAEKIFMTPPKPRPLSDLELEIMRSSHRSHVQFEGKQLALYSWGDGPTVILVHGWGSRAGRMTPFVKPLLDLGYSVVAFDAPAHGDSEGQQTSVIQVSECLKTVDDWCGHARFAIGHSMGGAAILIATSRGLHLNGAAVLGSPSELTGISFHFAYELGLPEKVRQIMVSSFENKLGEPLENFSVNKLSGSSQTPVLVCHDSDDREVSWQHGAAIATAWPNAELFTTTGLGHSRIVRDPRVVSKCVEFLHSR